ncbi:MAG: hypothetical protein GY940_23940, partial [bacterium]|nr:hypothetical protein [bacterium]
PTRFDEIENSGKAMFDLFRIHYLEPLDTRESEQLWQFLTGEAVGERRIRPIQILTGGNPRLIAILSSFAAGASFGQLMEQITRLIDEYTNYFKSNIESLPALERKIFVTLANIWEPATAAQVAGDARIAVNKTSSLLKRLELRGSVSAVKNTGGRKSYQVTERLYNIYHLMRLRGGQSGRVKAVVDFMVNFYEGEELAKKIAQMAKEACGIDKQNQSDYLEAYKEIFKTVENDHLREQILQLTEPQFLKLPGVLEALSPAIEDSHWIKEPHTAYGKKTTGELLRRRLNKAPRSFFYQHLLATVLAVQGKWDGAFSTAAEFLKNPSSGEEFPNDIIGFFIKAASAGYAKEGLKILKNSSCTSSMEPLIVALQMATGETFNAPQEVVEVAGDVHKQIEEKRKDHN